MDKINLLPVDLSPARSVVKIAALVRKISFLLIGVFVFAGTLAVVFVLFLKIQINSSQNKQNTITQSIKSLQSTEQKFFLTRDRLSKINAAFANKDAFPKFDVMNKILSNLPAELSVDSVDIDSGRGQFAVLSKDSLAMAQFLNQLVTSGNYKKVSLDGFIFSPSRGYVLTLEGS